jgi:hypothetical protein
MVAAVIGVVRVDRFTSARIGVEIADLSDPLTHGAPAIPGTASLRCRCRSARHR